ncbi:MAG TPA: hypothetical protein VFR06_02735 [Gallionellaceae bacterium]|nr:hypothetical protein [Gallionellaceae bacterium]
MDEIAFMHTLEAVHAKPCAFEKAILSRRCACPLQEKRFVAEREMVACKSTADRETCSALLDQLRQNSAFALKLTHVTLPLSYAQEVKVQCGGLIGLQQEMDGPELLDNVIGLVKAAREKFGDFEALPYSRIMQSVATHQLRKRHDKE